MDRLIEIALTNAAASAGLAVLVMATSLVCRRPALIRSLWIIVLLKLVTPPLVFLPLARPVVLERGLEPAPRQVPKAASAPVEERSTPPEPLPRLANPIDLKVFILPLWLLGSLGWFALAGVRTLSFQRLLRLGQAAPAELQNRAQRLAGRMGIAKCPLLWLLPRAISPVLWAFGGSPRVVLPERLLSELGENEVDSLLAHELAHLRRRDHWVRWLELLLAGVYWWDPVVWWAQRQIRQAEEECCDAWVVWTEPGASQAYGSALLKTLDFLSGVKPAFSTLASGMRGARGMKRRLSMILEGSTPKALSRVGWLSVMAVAALALPFFPTWAQTPKAQDYEKEQTTVLPNAAFKGEKAEIAAGDIEVLEFLRFLANYTGLKVILDSTHQRALKAPITIAASMKDVTGDIVIAILKANKFLVNEVTLPGGEKVWSVEPTANRRLDQVEEKLDRILHELEALRAAAKLGTDSEGTTKEPYAKGQPISKWIKDLGDRDEETYDRAVEVLGKIGADAVPHLTQALKSESPGVRRNAVRALLGIKDGEASDQARLQALKHPDPVVRSIAVSAIGSVKELLRALKDEDEDVRNAALSNLESTAIIAARDGAPEWDEVKDAVPAILEALKDPHHRQEALDALGELGPKANSAVGEISKLLKETDEGLRIKAALTLTKIGTDEAKAAVPVSLLKEALKGSSYSNREIVTALLDLGEKPLEALPALIESLDSDNPDIWTIARFGPIAKDAVPGLTAVLRRTKNENTQAMTIMALGEIRSEAQTAVPEINKLLNDRNGRVRKAAAEALKKIQGGAK